METIKFCMGYRFKNHKADFDKHYLDESPTSLDHPVIQKMIGIIKQDGDYFSEPIRATRIKRSFLLCYKASQYDGHRNEHSIYWTSAMPVDFEGDGKSFRENAPLCLLCGNQEVFHANIYKTNIFGINVPAVTYKPGINGNPDSFTISENCKASDDDMVCGKCGLKRIVSKEYMTSIYKHGDFMKYFEVPLEGL